MKFYIFRYFLRAEGTRLNCCTTDEILTDFLTKPLAINQMRKLRTSTGLAENNDSGHICQSVEVKFRLHAVQYTV